LAGKVTVVTGSRRGIGRAIALALAQAGADVAVSDVVADDGLLADLAEEIRRSGRRSLSLKIDISSRPQVEEGFGRIIERFGRIDILANCAGIWLPGQTLVECSEENWDQVIDTNLKGTWFCCQAAGKVMIQQNSGNIINISSQVGLNPGAGVGAYSISKAAIIMLTRQLALELAPYNIRVNAIAPGIVKTDFNRNIWNDPISEKRIERGIPLKRLAVADDIARTALFLASEDSGYITGDVIKVDGGWQAPSMSPGETIIKKPRGKVK
jgi:NAD(P)-dependent dehydrogenase (short-subunit alcohol dehydrogenase family)